MSLLYAKTSVALLRYTHIARADKLYYEAGISAQKQNWHGMAFMLLNRYIDIYDFIEDPDNNQL